MNPERPTSEEEQVTREELVEYLTMRRKKLENIVYKKGEKREEIMESSEAKHMLHNWITQHLDMGEDRIDVYNELGDICKEAGLDEESQRQYKNALDLAVSETKTEINPI